MEEGFENLSEVLERYGQAFITQYKANLAVPGKHGTGRRASGSLEDTMSTELGIDDDVLTVYLNVNEYWKWIEHGRNGKNKKRNNLPVEGGAWFPPHTAITQWIVDKGIPHGDDKELERMAWAIGKSIGLYGFEGRNDLERANQTVFDQFRQEIRDAAEKDMRNLIHAELFKN